MYSIRRVDGFLQTKQYKNIIEASQSHDVTDVCVVTSYVIPG